MEHSVLKPLQKFTWFGVILLLALALRLIAVVIWRDDLGSDPDAYRGLAERLVGGHGFVAPDGRPTAFRPPLYPLMLSAVHWAGARGIGVLHVALGVATTGVTYLVGARLRLRGWAFIAAVLVAIDPLLLRYTPQVMTEVTCAFWSAILLWLAARWTGDERWQLGTPILLGVVFGMATLSRPTFWVFGALGTACWIAYLYFGHCDDRPRQLRRGAAVAIAAAAVVLPWGLRNSFHLGQPIITTTHGGYTLLLANNPVFWTEVVEDPDADFWRGESLETWQRSLENEMIIAGVEPTDELARDEWFQDRALEQIREAPDRFLRSSLFRLRRLYDLAPAGGEGNDAPRIIAMTVGCFYAVVFTFALAGTLGLLAEAFRQRGKAGLSPHQRWLPVLLLIAAYSSVHAVYWTDARMRAPLVPAIALMTALGASFVRDHIRRKLRNRSL